MDFEVTLDEAGEERGDRAVVGAFDFVSGKHDPPRRPLSLGG